MPRQMADSMAADLCMWGAQRSLNVFVFKWFLSRKLCLCLSCRGGMPSCHSDVSARNTGDALSPHLYFWSEELAVKLERNTDFIPQ